MSLQTQNMELFEKVLKLESKIAALQQEKESLCESLAAANTKAEKLNEDVKRLQGEREMRLTAERQLELANNAMKKAVREKSAQASKLSETQRALTQLKSLNPSKMKKNLAEVKRKNKDLQTKNGHLSTSNRTIQSNLRKLKDSLICVLAEDDHFYVSEDKNWGLKVTRYKYPDELVVEHTPLRIRLTHFDTGMMWIGQINDSGDNAEWISSTNLKAPADINSRAFTEINAIAKTGTLSQADHVTRHTFF